MEKKEDEDASHAADPPLEQGRAANEDIAKESGAASEEDGDQVDEASGDSFPTSDSDQRRPLMVTVPLESSGWQI